MNQPNVTSTLDGAIAIVGAACSYPGGCGDPEALWRLLREGGSGVGPAPSGRWPEGAPPPPPARRAGFLAAPFPFAFDAGFFGISAAEAKLIDPQQRLLLEVGWRALESAGLAIEPSAGRPVGVFVGIGTTDFQQTTLWRNGSAGADPFTATGVSFAAAAGRLSYCFGFTGPSLAVDTACSSSLVAFHLACQALRGGECEAALVAGVNALLAPHLFACLDAMNLLSPDGECRAFDARGNGYVRAEGCGAVVLMRLDEALSQGAAVLAVCRGSAVNQDGRTTSLTAPSGAAQERVIASALAKAQLSRHEVDYVEAHGTGTPLGDAIELNALANSYARDRREPLLVGSVKANIGHLEAGAGMAGLIKTILCLQHGEVPPHPLLRRPTPHLDWSNVALRVPVETTPWPVTDRPRRAAVSSFGFGGANAHVVLEQAPASAQREAKPLAAYALPLSARTPAALDELAADVAAWLEQAPRDLRDAAFTLGAGRASFAHRRVVVGADRAELAASLRGAERPAPTAEAGPVRARLMDLAELWTAGGEVDWGRLYGAAGGRIVAAPGHRFHRERHWPDAVPASSRPIGSAPARGLADWRRLIDIEARAVLGDRPAASLDLDAPLVDQGFNSLLALELRRVLEVAAGRPLPPTLLYNYPSIRRLAEMLDSGVPPPADCGRPPPAAPTPAAADEEYAFLDALSDNELTALIEREVGQT